MPLSQESLKVLIENPAVDRSNCPWTISIQDGYLVIYTQKLVDELTEPPIFRIGGPGGMGLNKGLSKVSNGETGFLFMNLEQDRSIKEAIFLNVNMFCGIHSLEVEKADFYELNDPDLSAAMSTIQSFFAPDPSSSPKVAIEAFWMFPETEFNQPPTFPIKFKFLSPLH